MSLDVSVNGLGHQEPVGLSGGDKVANGGAGDLEMSHLQHVNLGHHLHDGSHVRTRSRSHDNLHPRQDLGRSMPGAQTSGGVGAEDQEELLVVGEGQKGLGRVGEALPDHFSIVGLEAGHAGHCETGHLEAVLIGGDTATQLLPRVTGRHEEDTIQVELVQGALTGVQVGDVDGVECPTEDPGSHAGEDRAWAARPGEVHG